MGLASSHETYMKCLTCYPSLVKDWDLQLLLITSMRPAIGGLYNPRPQSLMESFVPFGGFFPMASDLKGPLSSTYQPMSRCNLCDEKYEQEVAAILKGYTVSAADQHQAGLPSWLRRAESISTNKELDVAKAKDDGTVLNANVMELQQKWNNNCRRLHHSSQMLLPDTYRAGAQVLPGMVGLPYVERKERADDHNRKNTDVSENQCRRGNVFCAPIDLQQLSSPEQSKPRVSEHKHKNLSQMQGLPPALSDLGVPNVHASPSSTTTVTTDLVLGTHHVSPSMEQEKHALQTHKERLQDFTGCLPANVDAVSGTFSSVARVQPSTCSSYFSNFVEQNSYSPLTTSQGSHVSNAGVASPNQRGLNFSSDISGQFGPRDFKALWKALADKVGRQDEAIRAISQTIAYYREGNERCRGASLKRDIWLTFLGPDRLGKKRVAVALAEIICGSRENFICVDLSSHDGIARSNTIFDHQEINGYDVKFRGKTVVDRIAEEIGKKPSAVVFLENVDKADLLVQNSLLQAIKTGKISDSHGRQIGINNAIFVMTAKAAKGKMVTEKECITFSEERILAAQGLQMQILIGCVPEAASSNLNILVTTRNEPDIKQGISSPVYVNKRKLSDVCHHKAQHDSTEVTKRSHRTSNSYLDLNLSIEELEANEPDSGNDESDSISENTEAWIEEFFGLMDRKVNFRPFDFDSLADNVLKEISGSFRNTMGSDSLLEIDSKVMEQILAAAWLSDGTRGVKDWVEKVLCRSFAEARQRYNPSSSSVLKLVSCEDLYMEEQAPGVCLPARIIMN
eukprot:TRINITY_DN9714_c0_g2_i1.p1 TRINITY_DN9714_c0_g2~~TRINITY_DN9714_c0_g2_i1.p1  ORF type:complete len:795 (-),score=164.76 TRINITY_DN9714_c0_g2_i1:97-2481(-)